jgi:hypothetical protein
MNRRIAEIERLLAGQHVAGAAPGLADGTWSRSGSRMVTSRRIGSSRSRRRTETTW